MNWAIPFDGQSGLGGLDLKQTGLPSLEDMIARYCEATGRDGLPDLHWYFAYNLFRLAGIVQGVKKRLADGNARSEEHTSELQSLMRTSYAVFCLKKKNQQLQSTTLHPINY